MNNDFIQIWQDACKIIKNEITEISYNTWFKPIEPVSIENSKINLYTSSNFSKEILCERYGTLIKNALRIVTSKEFQINIITSSSNNMQKNHISDEVNKKYDVLLSPSYKFENFIIGENNVLAYKAALSIADKNLNRFNPLFIHGEAGLGKTHLLEAICHYTINKNPGCKFLYITIDQFTHELILSIAHDNSNIFLERYLQLDMLLVDNFQFINGKERTQEEFYNIYNRMLKAGKRIVIASQKSPESLKYLGNRLSSSLEIGLIAEIKAPDYETRVSIVKKLGEDNDVNIPKEVAEYLAGKVVSNIRELKTAYNKVVAISELLNEELNLKTAQKSFGE